MRYKRVGTGRRSLHGSKGFRLYPRSRRLWVQGLRARFFYFFRRALQLIKKIGISSIIIKRNKGNEMGSCRSLVPRKVPLPSSNRLISSLGRSNSFYSEAIADCLEFIKRSSLSVDQNQPPAACPT